MSQSFKKRVENLTQYHNTDSWYYHVNDVEVWDGWYESTYAYTSDKLEQDGVEMDKDKSTFEGFHHQGSHAGLIIEVDKIKVWLRSQGIRTSKHLVQIIEDYGMPVTYVASYSFRHYQTQFLDDNDFDHIVKQYQEDHDLKLTKKQVTSLEEKLKEIDDAWNKYHKDRQQEFFNELQSEYEYESDYQSGRHLYNDCEELRQEFMRDKDTFRCLQETPEPCPEALERTLQGLAITYATYRQKRVYLTDWIKSNTGQSDGKGIPYGDIAH